MTKRLIVGVWRGQYFFCSTGSVRKLARDWTTGRSRGWLCRSCQGLPKWWNLGNVAFSLKKLSQSSQYGGSKAIVIFSVIAYSLLLFLLLRFSILFLFLSGVYHPVFINRWHWPCSYVRTGAQVATSWAKSIFSDVMSSSVICLPCVHNLSCMIHLISAKRGSESTEINSCDTHCSGLLIPTFHVLWP